MPPGLAEISRSAVLTDLMWYGSKADEKTCSGSTGIVLERRWGSDCGALSAASI